MHEYLESLQARLHTVVSITTGNFYEIHCNRLLLVFRNSERASI